MGKLALVPLAGAYAMHVVQAHWGGHLLVGHSQSQQGILVGLVGKKLA